MTGLISGDPVDSLTLAAQGSDAVVSSPGEVDAASFASAWNANPTVRLLRSQDRYNASGIPPVAADYWARYQDPAGRNQGSDVDAMAAEPSPVPAPVMLTPDQANARYGIKGDLNFDQPVSEQTAASLFDLHHAEMLRQDIIARRGDALLSGGVARLGIGFAAGMLDPLNIAASFIPVVPEARVAGALADAGSALGRAGIRAGVGAVQGAAGQAALEPLNYLFDTQEHEDWTAAQAMRNIAFGGVLGGGLHVAGGAVIDRLTGRYADPMARRMEALGPEAREATLASAVAQTAEGRPVDVAPLVGMEAARASQLDTTALNSAFAARLAARGDTEPGNYAAYTPQGQRVELRPEVVELNDLTASHLPGGAVNPEFPHAEGMQPRDRSSAASQAQINEMASRLEPERLGPSPEASTGSPIVNGDNVVESGNGRVLALRRVYSDPALADQAQAYRAYLAARGYDLSGMENPVLVGRRVTPLDEAGRQDFVRGANERSTLGMNAAEQAKEPHPGPDMFGAPETTPGDILRALKPDDAAMQRAAQALIDAARQPGTDAGDAAVSRQAAEAAAAPADPVKAVTEQVTDLDSFLKSAREAGALDAHDETLLRQMDADLAAGTDLASAYQAAAACILRGNA